MNHYPELENLIGCQNVHSNISYSKSLLGANLQFHRITANKFTNNGVAGLNYTAIGGNNLPIVIDSNIFIRNGKTTNYYQTSERNRAAILANVMDSDVTFENNFLSDNAGGIVMQVQNIAKSSKVNIWSNTIKYCSTGDSIRVIGLTTNSFKQLCHIDDNVIQHNQGNSYSNVIQLENVVATITRNIVYNNSARHILKWRQSHHWPYPQYVFDNFIYFNKQTIASSGGAIVAAATNAFFHNNYIKNPTFKFEITSEYANNVVNASLNWWGINNQEKFRYRVKDNRVISRFRKIYYEPILTSSKRFLTGKY